MIKDSEIYRNEDERPKHRFYSQLGCNELETRALLLLNESNCIHFETNYSIQFKVNENEIIESFYSDKECQNKVQNKEEQKYECNKCIENMTVSCESFIKFIEEQQERKLSTFEKVSIPLDIIIVLTGIIGSVLIVLGGIFHFKRMFSFENENVEEITPYISVGMEDGIEPQNLDF